MNKIFLAILLSLMVVSCGGTSGAQGGAEVGNPVARSVLGQVAPEGSASFLVTQMAHVVSCVADTVIATDSLGSTTVAQVGNDCSFSLSLAINKAYALSLVKNDAFVASMIFNNGPGILGSSVMILSSGNTSLDLGLITITGVTAYAENEPSEQCDQDEDGISDYDDSDDDNDGQLDDDETDCDLDGYFDDYDDDSCVDDENSESSDDDSDAGSDAGAVVLEVSPRQAATHVDIDDRIEVRTGCSLDTTTVNSTTVVLESSEETIECLFEFSASDTQFECEPAQVLAPETIYTVTLDGVQCLEGADIPLTTWSFTTEAAES